MKITVTLLMLSALLLSTALAQEYTELNLPEGAVGRLGKGSINVVRYSPDGAQLAIATSIGIWLYDIGSHREIALITTHPGAVSCVAFSPDGQLLAGGSGDGSVRVWDVKTGELRWTRPGREAHEGGVSSVVFSPDGRFLVSGGTDWGAEVWGAKGGSGWDGISHRGPISSIAFSPDGKTLISGSGNGTVRLWDFTVIPVPIDDLPPGTKPRRSWDGIRVERKKGFAERKRGIAGHISAVSSIVFNPNGKTFTTGASDGTLRLWDAATDQLMGTFRRAYRYGHRGD